MTRLAQLIAQEEGFFKSGSLPSRRNNPGDLRHSPHSSHDGIGANDIGAIDTAADGWADLERQLVLDAAKLVSVDPVTRLPVPHHYMTLADAIYSWAPPEENDSAAYLRFIVNGFGGVVDERSQLSHVLEIPAVAVIS